jgi:sulfate transport system ATP-binding protein/putative spermidine/putrescine transport system ATP-binding protein
MNFYLEHLDIKIDNFKLKLSRIDFCNPGVNLIYAASGIGKSTLLKVIYGEVKANSNFKLILNDSNLMQASIQNRNLGVVMQNYAVFDNLTVIENLSLIYKSKKSSYQKNPIKLKNLLDRLEILNLVNNEASTLSGGQKQRLAFAMALVAEPKLLLLDEPFSALDEKLKKTCRKLLQEYCLEYQIPALLVSHNKEDLSFAKKNIELIPE